MRKLEAGDRFSIESICGRHFIAVSATNDGSVQEVAAVDTSRDAIDVVIDHDGGSGVAHAACGCGFGKEFAVDEIRLHGDTDNDDKTSTIGGGAGYEKQVTRSDADYVVGERYDLADALMIASRADTVFIPGDMRISMETTFNIPSGVTLASDRGVGGSDGALLYADTTPHVMFRPQSNVRVTGLRIRGPTPGRTVTYEDGIEYETPTYAMKVEGDTVEVDNCEIWGWPDRAVYAYADDAHVHHNYIYDNNGQGLGYGVSARGDTLIEYNYFHNNRHSITAAEDASGYEARYNHISHKSVMWPIDIHSPFEGDAVVSSNIVENGESRTWDNPVAEGIAGYGDGFNGGTLTVEDNWFFDEATAFDDSFDDVSSSGNVYGDEDAHVPSDIIPDHPGLSDRPWV